MNVEQYVISFIREDLSETQLANLRDIIAHAITTALEIEEGISFDITEM